MFSDKFELLDSEGNVIATKCILHHLRVVLTDRGGVKLGETFTVRSVVNSRQVFTVTDKTSSEEWHEFDRKCQMLFD